MFGEISERFKKISINHFRVLNPNGTIDIEATLINFNSYIKEQKDILNDINNNINKYFVNLLNENSMTMISAKTAKFMVKAKSEKDNINIEFNQIDNWLANAIAKKYIYSKPGSSGGIQTWDNAKQIVANNLISKKKIKQGENPLEKAEELMASK